MLYTTPLSCELRGKHVEPMLEAMPPLRVKLNTHASVLEDEVGTGMVLRDYDGSVIFSSCRCITSCDDVLEAELLALKEEISLALQWSSLPIDVETDCMEAVRMIKEGHRNKSKYAFIVRGIISSM